MAEIFSFATALKDGGFLSERAGLDASAGPAVTRIFDGLAVLMVELIEDVITITPVVEAIDNVLPRVVAHVFLALAAGSPGGIIAKATVD